MPNEYLVKRPVCPACGSTRSHTLYSCRFTESPIREYLVEYYKESKDLDYKYLEDSDFLIEECDDCSLMFQRYFPGEILSEMLYNERLDKNLAVESLDYEGARGYCARIAELMLSFGELIGKVPSDMKVYDFGLGWSVWATLGLGFGYQMYGSELVEVKKKHATSRGIKIIELEEVPNHQFDFINSDWVFEHLFYPGETMKILCQGLAPKGILKIGVPLGEDMKKRLKHNDWTAPKFSRWSLNSVHPLEHINYYQDDSLDKLAVSCGLRRMKIPIKNQYMMFRWGAPKELLKSLIRPFYHNFYRGYDVRYYTPMK